MSLMADLAFVKSTEFLSHTSSIQLAYWKLQASPSWSMFPPALSPPFSLLRFLLTSYGSRSYTKAEAHVCAELFSTS